MMTFRQASTTLRPFDKLRDRRLRAKAQGKAQRLSSGSATGVSFTEIAPGSQPADTLRVVAHFQ